MGTRALTIVQDNKNNDYCVLYCQFDGYINGGHGEELATFLNRFEIVNGIGSDIPPKSANGVACLAAQIVAHFKTGVGGFYLERSGTRNYGQSYTYYVIVEPEKLIVKVMDYDDKEIFSGTPKELLEFKESDEDEE